MLAVLAGRAIYRSVPPQTVGELERVVAGCSDARRLVAETQELCGRHTRDSTTGSAAAVRMVDDAGRIDLGVEGVAAAIEAEAFLSISTHPGGSVKADDYMEDLTRSLRQDIEQALAELRQRWRGHGPTTGVRF